MNAPDLAWYCARTKPKHEHIAAANVRKLLGLQVFLPQLRLDRPTRRGVVRVTEPLFPCYVFVRCRIAESLADLRYVNGVSTIVHFNDRIPSIADGVIGELQAAFCAEEPLVVQDGLAAGAAVSLADGAFAGMNASVLRVLPSRQRVQVLLDILGRPTAVEVDRCSVIPEANSLAALMPSLAAA
jgi:transcriptional antiterminator RfaH